MSEIFWFSAIIMGVILNILFYGIKRLIQKNKINNKEQQEMLESLAECGNNYYKTTSKQDIALVFCKNCIHLRLTEEFDDDNEIYIYKDCYAPQNMKNNYLEQIPYNAPKNLNCNNNCKWYEEKNQMSKIYCKDCQYYFNGIQPNDKCYAPENMGDSYKESVPKDHPEILNLRNNCPYFQLK